jgi:hypothetical protein
MAMSNSEPSIAIDCGRRGDTASSVPTTTMKQPSAEANAASNKLR